VLRAALAPLRTHRRRLRRVERRKPLAPELVAGQARHINVVLRQGAGIRRRLDRADQAPAPAEFHRADTDQVHARLIDRTVRLLDQQTFDPAPAEIAGEREADRAGADDQDGNDTFLRHVGIIVTGPAGTTPCNDGLYFLRISLEEFTTACR